MWSWLTRTLRCKEVKNFIESKLIFPILNQKFKDISKNEFTLIYGKSKQKV